MYAPISLCEFMYSLHKHSRVNCFSPIFVCSAAIPLFAAAVVGLS